MQPLSTFFLFLMIFSITLFAKVPILITKASSTLVEEKVFSMLFKEIYIEDEDKILTYFLNKESNFALIRKDILEKLSLRSNHLPYYIIGELSKRMKLLFLANNKPYKTIQSLSHKTIAIDPLHYKTNGYFKNILKKEALLFDVNIHSMDFYAAMRILKAKKLDTIFMLTSPQIEEKFKDYVYPYPKGFMTSLAQNPALSCTKEQCTFKYYLIASGHVGKMVMHNIYTQLKPLWSKNKNLLFSVGNYYIDTTYNLSKLTQQKQVSMTTKHLIGVKFGRTPWMDIAINEAILGKGSAENVFPMLDLSYKYIRFSKGKNGITTAPNDSKMGSWCAAYICWTLDKSGYKVHPKGRMASQSFRYFKDKLYKRINKPIFGSITLYTSMRNPKHGHVGYLFGRTTSGKNILLGGNQNNRLKFTSYPARSFGNYKFNGFYIPINYTIKKRDYLTRKDIYSSAKKLNNRYGIREGKSTYKVR